MPHAALLMLAQAATLPMPPVVDHAPTTDRDSVTGREKALAQFDLATLKSSTPACAGGDLSATDIIVCGKKNNNFRIDRDAFEQRPADFSTHLLGADVRPVAIQRGLPGGISAPAMTVNFKWKF